MPGADRYYVYRYVFPGGLFFYPTQEVAAASCSQGVCSYVEAGDGDYPGNADPNLDCPTAPGWSNGYENGINQSCGMGALGAYYVTAAYATGGESPRSEIVFWSCDETPGYARLDHDSSGFVLASKSLDQGYSDVPVETVDALLVCDVGDNTGVPAEASAGRELGTAPLLMLGASGGGGTPLIGIYGLHSDHLGSIRLVTDEATNVMAEHDFFPFGEEVLPTPDFSTKMFTGHERDRETGLDYMFARYYGNNLPRFLSPDPLGGNKASPQSWNRFAYVGNSPLNVIDPTGMYGINPNPYNPQGTNPCDGKGPMCEYSGKDAKRLENEIRKEKPQSPTGTGLVEKVDALKMKVKVKRSKKAAFAVHDSATGQAVPGTVRRVDPKNKKKLHRVLDELNHLAAPGQTVAALGDHSGRWGKKFVIEIFMGSRSLAKETMNLTEGEFERVQFVHGSGHALLGDSEPVVDLMEDAYRREIGLPGTP